MVGPIVYMYTGSITTLDFIELSCFCASLKDQVYPVLDIYKEFGHHKNNKICE